MNCSMRKCLILLGRNMYFSFAVEKGVASLSFLRANLWRQLFKLYFAFANKQSWNNTSRPKSKISPPFIM